jgi:hypothetical protein
MDNLAYRLIPQNNFDRTKAHGCRLQFGLRVLFFG